MAGPQISWDIGTAYDLFLSLYVLIYPEKTGLRASWAAGVRSRLSPEDRRTLEEGVRIFGAPLPWIYSLSGPKDCATALWELRRLQPGDRIQALALTASTEQPLTDFLLDLKGRGEWGEADFEKLHALLRAQHNHVAREEVTATLNGWARPGEFGERYLTALQAYYQAFFTEEEVIILPALKASLGHAQSLAGALPAAELIESLSQGVRVLSLLELDELVFVPSYWMTPLIYMAKVAPQTELIVFGARPAGASLVPGQVVPDLLLAALKALADPTRLRILRYLTQEPLTPAELSRRLRLRAPTVIHHLNALRLAGLVSFVITGEDERRYTARREGVQQLPGLLGEFLEGRKP